MQHVKQTTGKKMPFLLIAVAVLLFCLSLFYLDYETQSIADLLKPGNLIALVIYALPTFLICSLLYSYFIKKYQFAKSIALALVIGLPVTIALVITLMLLLRNYRHY